MSIYIYCLGVIFLLIGIILLISDLILGRNNNVIVRKRKNKDYRYAIIIPARDESKVIKCLIESIKRQSININMQDVYIIVENKNDPTVNIARKDNINIVLRRDLSLRRKGYAIDDAIKNIYSLNKSYDYYYIFDADNILDVKFIEEMNKSYIAGYDLGVGYRNTKNGNDNIISSASSLTFSMINSVGNTKNNKCRGNVIISGTGFYIDGKIIDKFGGFPFNSLTEDYELTLYSILNELTSTYNVKAIFYDEQPITYKQTVLQRIRWIKGYLSVRSKYISKIRKKLSCKSKNYGSKISACIGVWPYVFILIGILLIAIFLCPEPIIIVLIIIAVYILLMTFTIYMIIIERKKINLSNSMKLKIIFFNPIFLLTYIPCAIKAVLKKDVSWDRIEHSVNKINK